MRSGLTNADVFFQQRSQLIEQKITSKVTKGKDQVTDAQIQQYYEKNKSKFATPEKRDVRIVLAKTEANAAAARKALDSGQSWSAVAKKYSTDAASKSNGGLLAGVAKGQQEKALDAAIFKAQKGKLTGPVKTQFGYYVFEVQKITPATQQSLEESKKTISDQLEVDEPAEGADRLRQGLPEPLQGRDGLPQGLRHRRLQERAEEEGRDDHGPARRRSSRRRAPAPPARRSSRRGRRSPPPPPRSRASTR